MKLDKPRINVVEESFSKINRILNEIKCANPDDDSDAGLELLSVS